MNGTKIGTCVLRVSNRLGSGERMHDVRDGMKGIIERITSYEYMRECGKISGRHLVAAGQATFSRNYQWRTSESALVSVLEHASAVATYIAEVV